jgi:hypothetical protein
MATPGYLQGERVSLGVRQADWQAAGGGQDGLGLDDPHLQAGQPHANAGS